MFFNKLRELANYSLYLARIDWRFRASLILTFLGVLSALASIPFPSGGTAALILSWLGFVIAAAGIVPACQELRRHGPKSRFNEYRINQHDSIPTKALSRKKIAKLSDLLPPRSERRQGYVTRDPGLRNGDVATSSEQVDRWLCKQPEVRFSCERPPHFTSPLCGRQRYGPQMRYLHTAVFSKALTINESKISLRTAIHYETSSVILSKVGYYDALVTNEAYRCTLNRRQRGSSVQGHVVDDLRKFFPFHIETDGGRDVIALNPLDAASPMANHIGISTLVLSNDHYPVFFEQSSNSFQLPGKLVVTGSGSSDFGDIRASGARDLLGVIRYSMAREFAEEGLLTHRSHRRKLIQILAENTQVIGFFRWVNRGGKPEFLGITRCDLSREEIKADGREVVNIEGITDRSILDWTGFVQLYEDIKKSDYKVGLSSAMVLWRLRQIAISNTYEDSLIREEIGRFLGFDQS